MFSSHILDHPSESGVMSSNSEGFSPCSRLFYSIEVKVFVWRENDLHLNSLIPSNKTDAAVFLLVLMTSLPGLLPAD